MNYKQGDVFLARLTPNKGKEPGKDRPVIVIQSDALNESNYPTCIVIPCSSVETPTTEIRPLIKQDFFKKNTYALLDQVRSIDVAKRFLKKIGELDEKSLETLLSKFQNLISK